MKKWLHINISIVMIVVFGTFQSCNLDDGNTVPVPTTTVVEVAMLEADLTILVSALERANLTALLSSSGSFTVLAPTNAAFSAFMSNAGYASVNDVPVETLKQILLNHVVQPQVDAALLTNLQRNYLVNSANGPEGTKLVLYFDATSGITFNGTSKITKGDIPAANGIIHIVDGVIAIPSIDTFIAVDQNFKDLEQALDIVSPLSPVPAMLKDSGSGPLTLFAPSTHAFDNLFATNTAWNSVSDIDETYLTAIVGHHVVNGNLSKADIKAGEMATTVEGDNIMFKNLDGSIVITDGAGNQGAIIGVFDIQASNGVIHLLPDKVLLPDTTN